MTKEKMMPKMTMHKELNMLREEVEVLRKQKALEEKREAVEEKKETTLIDLTKESKDQR
jgi:hypothetical protein